MLKAFLTTLLFIFAATASADQSKVTDRTGEFPWEGYWSVKSISCWDNKEGVTPMRIFADQVEGYFGLCEVEEIVTDAGQLWFHFHPPLNIPPQSQIYRPAHPINYDLLKIQCAKDNNEKAKYDLRLLFSDEETLWLAWPLFPFSLKRCPPEPQTVTFDNPAIGGYDETLPK